MGRGGPVRFLGADALRAAADAANACRATAAGLAEAGVDHIGDRGWQEQVRASHVLADAAARYGYDDQDVMDEAARRRCLTRPLTLQPSRGVSMGSADSWPDLTGKSWAHKTSREMTDDEVTDARATFQAVGRPDYEGEWLRRHGLPWDYGL